MCGYCIEALGLKKTLFLDHSPEMFAHIFYLQETRDPVVAIQTVLAATTEPGQKRTEMETLGVLNAHTLLCKVLECIVTSGIQSESVKTLLASPWIQKAIFCESFDESCQIQSLSTLVLPHLKACYPLNRKITQSRFDTAATVFPDISFFRPLYEAGTCFVPERWEAFMADDALTAHCHGILTCYMEWWLEGGSIRHESDAAITEALDGTGVIFDPMMDLSNEDRLTFDLVFRALYFSLLVIGKSPECVDFILPLLTRQPEGVPDFDGYDLWLQRKAAEIVYHHKGIDPFIASIESIRTRIFAYLAAKYPDVGAVRERIKAEIHRSRFYYEQDTDAVYINDPDQILDDSEQIFEGD